MKKTTFATLDGLRGLAAVAVFTRHVPSRAWAWWLPGSYLAVDLFFMISGFVLAHAYGERLNRDLSTGRFMLARFIRLWPMYILGTLAVLFVHIAGTPAGQPVAWHGLVPSALFGLFMLPTPPAVSGVTSPFPLNGPAWSLFWELTISIVFAVLGPRMRAGRLALVVAVGAGLLVATAGTFGSLDSGFDWSNFLGGGGRVVFTFFAGVAIYRVQQARPSRGVPAWIWAIVLGAVFAGHVAPAWRAIYDVAMVVAVFPTIVYMGACREPQGWLRWLALALGKISYPLYVIQVALISGASLACARLFGIEFSALSHVGTFGLLAFGMMLALVLARFYDEPVRAWLTRRSKLGTRSVRAAEAAAP
ncbi:acyltransferase family protein [Glacieibacterium sp.]|uniref:acyltransferase family protein n=1 Tax=Glacieibacterium sp. TaxID=2860237 RepID=UPI003B004796